MISDSDILTLLADVDLVDIGAGPVVALAHGAGGGVRENFAGLIAAGSGLHRFTGPYYPGSGASRMPTASLSIDDLADSVVAAALSTGAGRFPIIGLSLGSAVAVTAAHRHPEHVSALVLTVGLARPDPQSLAFVRVWRQLARDGHLGVLAELLLYAANSPATLHSMTPTDHAAAVNEIERTYPPGGAAHAELVTRVDVTGLLESITVPTLVVVAGQDRIVLPATARLLAGIPGAELIEYPDAGHIFTPAEGRRWADDLVRFLDRIEQ